MDAREWIALAAAAALGYWGWRMTLPRGIRNNNPGNIRRSAIDWEGQVPGSDPEFVTFEGPEWGIRAMARILKTYRDRYGLRTVREIITRWAPPIENDTAAYAEHVAAVLGQAPDDEVQPVDVPLLIAAMIRHENGQQPYTEATILEGVSLA